MNSRPEVFKKISEPLLSHKLNSSKGGFTLAETLITLAVIGIVAALTIPALIQKHEERVLVTKIKKTYSMLSQAYQMAIIENGTQDQWNIAFSDYNGKDNEVSDDWVESDDSKQGRDLWLDVLAKYLNVTERNRYTDCKKYSDKYKMYYLTGAKMPNDPYCPMAILADGTSIVHVYHGSSGYTDIKVDFNGTKGPNTLGKDIFLFEFQKDRMTYIYGEKTAQEAYEKKCINNTGTGCLGWVLTFGNLDYLHCKNLEWGGKCK